MVIITVYTVGYGEVHPINSTALDLITMGLIVLGGTGIIFLTGVMVQFITLSQINKVRGLKRMNVLIGRPHRSALLTSLFEPRVRTGVRG